MSKRINNILANRYQLHEALGTGAMGVVYRATDRLTGDTLALKRVTLSPAQLQFASRLNLDDDSAQQQETLRLALAREFQTLAGLRHPNIISVIDYGFDRTPGGTPQPYFTMNYLPHAQTILEAGTGKSVADKVALLVQMLQALAYLHRRGILHRDLKPANVLVTDGRVRVLDFGLAVPREMAEGRTGTPAYMAPETIRYGQATEATDLHTVGVLAYELFAGERPFTDVMGILTKPPDMAALEITAPLQAVVTQLLEKDPAGRYPDAQATIAALREGFGQPPLPEDPTIRESFLQAATFVGREAEQKQLTNALENAMMGKGSAWLVGGESGVGKSRLLDELRIRALVAGATVLRGQGVEGGGQTYQLWRTPLRHLALMAELNDLEAGVIKPLVSDISALLGREIPDAPELEGEAKRQRLHLTIAEICRTVSKKNAPLILLLEDLHWTSKSLEPLKALHHWVADLPLLVIGNYRNDERPDLPAILPNMHPLPLARLSPKNMMKLSVSMLGQSGSQPQVLSLLQKETEGNTFFLVETMRTLAEEAGRLDAVGDMTLPDEVFAGGVRRIIRRRLVRVPPEHQPLLKLAAIAGRALDLDVLQAATSQTDLETWLAACANVAVLEVREGQWLFAHDKLRSELTSILEEDERPPLHRQVAEAYENVYLDQPSYAATLMKHWDMAGEREKTRHYARLAGKYAATQYANEEAAHYFSRALALTPEDDPARRYALHLEREEIYNRLGLREAQETDLIQQAFLAGSPTQRVAAALRYGAYHNAVGDYEAALAISKQASQWAAKSGDGPSQAQGMINSGQALLHQGVYEMASQQYQRASDLAQTAMAPIQVARAWGGLGRCAFRLGDYPTAIDYHQQALHLRKEIDDQPGQMQSLRNLGQAASAQGKYETAHQYHLQALQLARQMGDRPNEGRFLLALGESSWRQRAYPQAESYLQQSLSLAQTVGDKLTEATSLKTLGNVTAYQGQSDRAKVYFEQSLAVSQEIGDQDGESRTLNNLGYISMRQEQYSQATAYFEQSLVISQEIGGRDVEGTALNNLGQVAYNQGLYANARDYYERSLVIRHEIGERAGEGSTLSNLGRVAYSQGLYADARDYYEQSLLIIREIGNRAWEGRTLNYLGALALAEAAFQQAQTVYKQSSTIRKELNQPRLLVEDLAGLALVAFRQNDLELAQMYADQLLVVWASNPTFRGMEHPMWALHFIWQVCEGLELVQADDVLAAAAGVMQTYLDNQPDPEAQAVYLQQRHHQPLWAAWQERRG
ncbi:MAG: tetratricopeptide repeat protein [Gammaproteobacteria bacterium]|nr:tetratricopeptide repeat protein [Gammaproteobacteria bacterium]